MAILASARWQRHTPAELVEEIQHERDVQIARHGFIRVAEYRDVSTVGREIDTEVDPRVEWDGVNPTPRFGGCERLPLQRVVHDHHMTVGLFEPINLARCWGD